MSAAAAAAAAAAPAARAGRDSDDLRRQRLVTEAAACQTLTDSGRGVGGAPLTPSQAQARLGRPRAGIPWGHGFRCRAGPGLGHRPRLAVAQTQ
jgi:hypothetical protein